MAHDEDKKEQSPLILKVSPEGTHVKNKRKSLTGKRIFTKDSAIDFDDEVFSKGFRCAPEGSNKKETTITTNFATPPRPKK